MTIPFPFSALVHHQSPLVFILGFLRLPPSRHIPDTIHCTRILGGPPRSPQSQTKYVLFVFSAICLSHPEFDAMVHDLCSAPLSPPVRLLTYLPRTPGQHRTIFRRVFFVITRNLFARRNASHLVVGMARLGLQAPALARLCMALAFQEGRPGPSRPKPQAGQKPRPEPRPTAI